MQLNAATRWPPELTDRRGMPIPQEHRVEHDTDENHKRGLPMLFDGATESSELGEEVRRCDGDVK